ncbi:MAG TPA: hypothetical protein VFF06_22380 [Polyangia bacterium]|nr:hypothetical protein [Polyangia bacterium]
MLRKGLRVIVDAWLICGSLALLLGVTELGCQAWLRIHPAPDPFWDATALRVQAEHDAPWTDGYQTELQRSFDAVEYQDFVSWRHRPEHGLYLNVDDDGNRRTWNPPLPDGAPEIWLFGGSTLWGFGVRDDHTIASELSRRLSEAGVAARVRNFGEWAFVSTQELLLLLSALQAPQRPAIVIFFDGLNDVCWPLSNDEGEPRTQRSRRLHLPTVGGALRTLLHRFALYRSLTRRPPPALPPERFEAAAQEIARVYVTNVRAAEALAGRFEFQALFYWQPTIVRKRELSPLEQRLRFVEPMMHGPGRRLFELTSQAVLASLRDDRSFHDVEDLFAAERDTIYADNLHYTEAASARIAARLADDVLPLVRARSSSAAARR